MRLHPPLLEKPSKDRRAPACQGENWGEKKEEINVQSKQARPGPPGSAGDIAGSQALL